MVITNNTDKKIPLVNGDIIKPHGKKEILSVDKKLKDQLNLLVKSNLVFIA